MSAQPTNASSVSQGLRRSKWRAAACGRLGPEVGRRRVRQLGGRKHPPYIVEPLFRFE